MNAQPCGRLTAVLLIFSRCAIGAVIVIATLALAGWAFYRERLTTLFPAGSTPMNPVSAVGMLLSALSLALLYSNPPRRSPRRIVAMGFAAAVVLIGAVKFVSYRIPIPIDTLLFPSQTADSPIAPNTASGFLTIGMALLFLDFSTTNRHRPTVPLSLLTIAVAMLAITGYLFEVSQLYGVLGYIPMAFNTAAAFLLLGLAILAARPCHEPIATLVSDTAGGAVARRLLPAAAVLPLAVGWLCIQGGRHEFYQRPFGATLYSLLTTVIFVTLIWWNARFLRRLDIERRSAERHLADEHHLIRALIDNLPDWVFVKDRQSRFLLTNIAHSRGIKAGTPEQMIGKTDVDFHPPVQAAQYRADEEKVMQTGVPIIDREQPTIDPHGNLHWLTVTKAPFRDAQGEIVGTVGIAHDVTLRKQAEEERDRFFTLSADMMCVAGFDGFFKRINPAFETILGYGAEEILSRPWIDFVHPDDLAATIAEGKKLSLGAVTLYFENRYLCKDGTYRWLSWTAVPVVHEQRMYAVARDTTGRRKAEEQLRDANRRLQEAIGSERLAQQSLRTAQSTLVQTEKLAGLGQMVAGVAHEINNPLSFVSNNVAVLQRDLRGILRLLALYNSADELIQAQNQHLMAQIRDIGQEIDLKYVLGNLQDLLGRSREGLRRIQQIVKDLRDFARLDESDLHEVNLNDGLQSTVTIIHGHAKKHNVELETDLAADLPPVTCFPAKVNQVVMNLLTNAIDACGQDGKVTLRTRAEGSDAVRIEVSDNGAGIDPAIRERIFDPFFTTKPPGKGTGLGLSISYGIVKDHEGTICVRSETGKGSTFVVTLPIKGPREVGSRALSARIAPLAPHL